jgi:hypothetical protein
MKTLTGKKVLLIAPAYHNYFSIIASAFGSLGALVETYTTDPTTVLYSNFYLSRLRRFSLLQSRFKKEIIFRNAEILDSIKGKQFDYVVIIKGDLLTDEFIIELRNILPTTNFILYQWDPIKHYNYLERIKYFDSVFSFDYADCSSNKQISYLPLFYSDEYAKIALIKGINYKYDLFFLGVNDNKRAKKLFEMVDYCKAKGLRYSVNLMTTISEKICLDFTRSKINCFFKSLKFDQFSEKYIKSKAIIDICYPYQTGLSMRVIEALGADKKIVTSNSNIVNESFYDPNMVFIWNKDNPEDLMEFLNRKHEKALSEKYSVRSFVLNLLQMRD